MGGMSDRNWYAVDLYIQTPRMIHNILGEYLWYVLWDAIEPTEWYQAKVVWSEGTRCMPDTTLAIARILYRRG